MANAAKYSKGACGHMLKHYERAKDENGEYVRFGNQDIDTTRSHLNYNLAPERSEGQYNFIKQRCSEVYCLNRSDVNVLCSWVVTAPKGLDPAEHDRFFRKSYDALAKKYGEENVVSAYVHKDESGQPHMHFAFVPVTWDKKKERYTVKAKDVISKAELKKFHPWLTEVMKQEFGRDIGIETGELSTRGNLTMDQYKAVQEANAEVQRVNQKVEEATRELQEKIREVEKVSAQLDALKAPEAVQDIQGKPSFTGKWTKVRTEEYNLLKEYADKSAVAIESGRKMAASAESWRSAYRDLDRKYQKVSDELNTWRLGIKSSERNRELQQEITAMKEFLQQHRLLEQFRQWREKWQQKQAQRQAKRTTHTYGDH